MKKECKGRYSCPVENKIRCNSLDEKKEASKKGYAQAKSELPRYPFLTDDSKLNPVVKRKTDLQPKKGRKFRWRKPKTDPAFEAEIDKRVSAKQITPKQGEQLKRGSQLLQATNPDIIDDLELKNNSLESRLEAGRRRYGSC